MCYISHKHMYMNVCMYIGQHINNSYILDLPILIVKLFMRDSINICGEVITGFIHPVSSICPNI